MSMREPRLVIVAGRRGRGKTTVCMKARDLIAAKDGDCAGILCPSDRDQDGMPYRIRAMNIASGETRLLARRPSGERSAFIFEDECFLWADSILRRETMREGVIIFLDEVGPLELDGGGGFYPFLSWFLNRGKGRIVVTVRCSLLSELCTIAEKHGIDPRDVAIVDLDSGDYENAATMIRDSLLRLPVGHNAIIV